jgi:hypothetical protein
MKGRVSPHVKRTLRRLAEVLSTVSEADPQVRNAILLKLLRQRNTSGTVDLPRKPLAAVTKIEIRSSTGAFGCAERLSL